MVRLACASFHSFKPRRNPPRLPPLLDYRACITRTNSAARPRSRERHDIALRDRCRLPHPRQPA
jgi:hypothetical protein